MTIEQKINRWLRLFKRKIKNNVEEWSWCGDPYLSKYKLDAAAISWWVIGDDIEFTNEVYNKVPNNIIRKIKKADTSECLFSPSEYIRECKKYYMENENDNRRKD